MHGTLARQLAALVLLLCAAARIKCDDSIECLVPEADGSTSTFNPGLFPLPAPPTLVPAPSADGGAAGCPDPRAVPAGSKAPFFLGTATAAYQVEGAASEGGRGASIWDVFSKTPGKVYNGDTGDVATDFYNRYPLDIALMRSLGLRNFRLSLSWTRLFPSGTGSLNQDGVDFYSRLIDDLKAACIEPYITLYHWDLPQTLYEQYGGWIDSQIVPDFAAYAEAAFKLFGDRVKYWFTLNEPETYCQLGCGTGTHAPGRCSDKSKCQQGGDSDREPHLCAYYSLLAHATAVQSFRRLVPGGKIAMTNSIGWSEPFTSNSQDTAAAERQQAYTGGYFLDPIYRGDWPAERKKVLGSLLPPFTPDQQQLLLANKQDFLALQHYTGNYVYFNETGGALQFGTSNTSSDGVPLPVADSTWLFVFPKALRSLLVWLSQRYGSPDIIITENGVSAPGESSKAVRDVLCDTFRLQYFQQYISNATEAVRQEGVKLQGYFAWSLLDNFEWADGYSKRFGIVYVDFGTLARYYKASAIWLATWFGLISS